MAVDYLANVMPDDFPKTKEGQQQRCLAFAEAIHLAFLDPQAPLPTLLVRSDHFYDQVDDILALGVLQLARSMGMPILHQEFSQIEWERVASELGWQFEDGVIDSAIGLVDRMRTLHAALQQGDPSLAQRIKLIEDAYNSSGGDERRLREQRAYELKPREMRAFERQAAVQDYAEGGLSTEAIAQAVGMHLAAVKRHLARVNPPHTLWLVYPWPPLAEGESSLDHPEDPRSGPWRRTHSLERSGATVDAKAKARAR
ncbi:hypothetical protein [Dyella sp. GSA-30]|uniref:hypothetical protein n=1 Tax=Dyella sp. GSA-30 TaxID=2994496 RepID=UPI00248F6991|nr:hypothetical protein [Dyella sp. GSA-30]BDU22901.1 hypothetical protein DYGSA30_43580 [Dyella sp. GSA-30]